MNFASQSRQQQIDTLLEKVDHKIPYDADAAWQFCIESEARLLSKPSAMNIRGIAQIAYLKGRLASTHGGHFMEAIQHLKTSLDYFREVDDVRYQIKCLTELGLAYQYLTMQSMATSHFFEALRLALELGDPIPLSHVYYRFGIMYAYQESHGRAYESTLKALSCAEEGKDIRLACYAKSSIGNLLGHLNRVEEGIKWTLEALDDCLAHEFDHIARYSRYYLINLYRLAKRYEEALAQSKIVLGSYDLLPSVTAIEFLIDTADLYVDMQDFDKAVATLAQAEQEIADRVSDTHKIPLYHVYTKMYESTGQYAKALEMLKRYVAISEKFRANREKSHLHAVEVHFAKEKAEQTAEIRRLRMVELVAKNEELAVLNREKDEILGIVAHDLRNPLSSIVITSAMLRDHFDRFTVDQQLERLHRIHKSAANMTDIVSSLMEMQRADDHFGEVKMSLTAVAPILNSVVQEMRPQAAEKKIALNVLFAPPSLLVQADPLLLQRILENLVSNAIKYSLADTAVTLRAFSFAQRAVITVADQGLGFCEADKSRIFQKFARLSAKPTAGEQATGLGLYIVKKLAEEMNGTIQVESEGKNLGSTFTLTLPC